MARTATSLRAAAALRRLRAARGGIAAVEFAIGASFLIVAMLGLYDFGRASWHRMQVAAAAQAGAAYAVANGFNATGIALAVRGATDFAAVTATPAPTMQCGCPNGTSGITAAACGSTCPVVAGVAQVAGYYATVSARGTYSFMFPYPYVAKPIVMNARAVGKMQ